MDKPVLKNSLELFEQFGVVKSRSMFGGFGIFIDDVMFALVVNDLLYVRTCDSLNELFETSGYKPYVYKKRGFPVVTKYFALPNELWQDTDRIVAIALPALEAAKKEKLSNSVEKKQRLKDLPNLRLGTERMLKKAGITSVEELKEKGSVEAFKAMQKCHDSNMNIELLWALEGALLGKHWSVLPIERRDELVKEVNHKG